MTVFTLTGRHLPPPELQRLPPHTDEGRRILVAVQEADRPETPIIEVDYAALEQRVLAQVMANRVQAILVQTGGSLG